MIFKIFSLLFYYIFGNLLAPIIYEKKYINGKYFRGEYLGLKGRGWEWTVKDFSARSFLGKNRSIPFPISFSNQINNFKNIHFDLNDLQIFQGQGKYFQAQNANIYIGKGCHIANNVGIITTNHDINDPSEHLIGEDVILGDKCWIGMNSVILPGVILGAHTTVGAGSVVTKSFPNGNCVIAGTPAKVIKNL